MIPARRIAGIAAKIAARIACGDCAWELFNGLAEGSGEGVIENGLIDNFVTIAKAGKAYLVGDRSR
eukprot:5480762-Alexandrium_andersonii.AAC.1